MAHPDVLVYIQTVKTYLDKKEGRTTTNQGTVRIDTNYIEGV